MDALLKRSKCMLANLLAVDLGSVAMIVIMCAAVIGLMVYSSSKQKKRQQETMEMLDAIRPGNKVKTIGGICGVVVEVCPDDNTFILETGSETSGKSYIKFDKQAVYQTDAVVNKDEITLDAPVEEKAEETVAEAPAAEEPTDAE